jgi:ABC-type nickel/cobalt efflux system permease component RcnA
MGGLDELLTTQAEGRGLGVVLAVALLLGIRHATDPDHLVAVSTLVATAREQPARAAARLGAAWGAGHAVTLVGFGVPVVLFHAWIPEVLQSLAEILIGAIIVLLAVRLLRAWRGGAFHAHVHEHGGERHAHLHAHAESGDHVHGHAVRTLGQGFAIGTAHGLAGSGAVTVLLLAAVPGRPAAALALVVLAFGAAISMTALSWGAGSLLGTARARRSLGPAVPVLGLAAAGFGAWYGVAAALAAA